MIRPDRSRLAAVFAFAALGFAARPARAAEQVVYLRDGSILHGEVTSMGDGIVVLETPHGTLKIPDSDVLRVQAIGAPESGTPSATPTVPPTQPTPLPGPTAAVVGAPAIPPSPPAIAPTRLRRRDPFREDAFGVEGKAGVHLYAGRGWSNFEEPSGSGPAAGGLEAVAFGGLQQEGSLRVDAIASVGFYAGGRDCSDATDPGCIPLSMATGYLDGGLRLSLYGPPLYLYIEGAGGGATSSFSYGAPGATATSTDTSGNSLEAHAAGGAGLALDQLLLFGEIKYSTAPTHLGNGLVLDMGGVTFSAGLGLLF